MKKSIFYRPEDGVAADFIPYYHNGKFHLFYLKDYRDVDVHGEGTPWFHLVTGDFVHFEDRGEVLPRGTKAEQDLYVFTGSVIENQKVPGDFRIFYTGHNPHLAALGRPVQAVMQAKSADLDHWRKDETFFFLAPSEMGYEPDDWRDPFVFWDAERQEYCMLLAARKIDGPSRNRGLTALAVSRDLTNWDVSEPFWAPDQYFTHECPDLFRMGEYWYLVFSTFSEKTVTHYRYSRSLNGPWIAPPDDQFDGRAYYAAKTATDGNRRYLFGWLATRSGMKDDGEWNWGGDLVVHQIEQQPDGTLSAQLPDPIRSVFQFKPHNQPAAILGDWKFDQNSCQSSSVGRNSSMIWGELPKEARVSCQVQLSPGTISAGILLRSDVEMSAYYQVRLEPGQSRLVVDRWPRPGDQPFMLERFTRIDFSRLIKIELMLSGSCLVIYLNDQTALSCRIYEHSVGNLGFFVVDGDVEFEEICVQTRDPIG